MVKISVIIPVYNMSGHLQECLESIVSQSLKEIQVICVNDGSTDNSLEIIHEYALQYSNILVIDQKNQGVAQARNNGMDLAIGEYVAFMDSDDYYPEKDILEILYYLAKYNNVLICGGSFSSFRDESERVIIKEYHGRNRDYIFRHDQIMNFEDYQFSQGFTRFIYNLKFLRENNIKFPLYRINEDPPFFVKAMIYARKFYVTNKITYCYRAGHKRSLFSLENTLDKTIDYAFGIIDVLIISSHYKYKKLHTITIELLHNDLSSSIYKHIANGDFELKQIVNDINRAIDVDLIEMESYIYDNPYLLEFNNALKFVDNSMYRMKMFSQTLYKYREAVIYGAGKVAIILAEYLISLNIITIKCFAVTDESNNPKSIYGIPVINIEYVPASDNGIIILLATFTNHHNGIMSILRKKSFKNILPVYYTDLNLWI